MGNIKIPAQYASGSDTFSDHLVGYQVVDGSSQMTNTSFDIDKIIPEKDSKKFHTQPFSDFLTLDSINQEKLQVQSTTTKAISSKSDEIKFYDSKNDGAKSLFGSLSSRLSVSVQNIITKFPAAIYVDKLSPYLTSENTATSISYDRYLNLTHFKVQKSLIFNPFNIVLIEPKSFIKPETVNNIRNFFSSYTKYVLEVDGKTYDIYNYTEPDADNNISLDVYGNCFSGVSGYTESFLLRPNNGIVEEFFKNLDELEIILLDRETIPKYQGKFRVPRDLDGGARTELVTEVVTWPTTKDGWNLQILGIDFDYYLERLKAIGDDIDNYKSNLIVRFLTAPQLFEFDTEEKKAESIFQIYGQNFDKVKKFIDNIAFMRNVTYDKINNVPDLLLKNLAVTLGFETVSLFDEKSLQDSLYTRIDSPYTGLNIGYNLVEAEYEFYRRLVVNLAYLYKSKGTRQAIEFFLKFIGAPEPMIRFDEYVYRVDGSLPTIDFEEDIQNAIQGIYIKYYGEYTGNTIDIEEEAPGGDDIMALMEGDIDFENDVNVENQYNVVAFTGATTISRDRYPVDRITGLPKGLETTDGDIFFQLGAGWREKTIGHRSHDIIDESSSNLTGRTKTIKTMSKPFTYGEDYFDVYRKLPGLDYGYDLISEIDNNKTHIIQSKEESQKILNRKNMTIFLSSDRAIDYDIYRKSQDLYLTFATLPPQTGATFTEFLDDVLDVIIKNSNTIKYKKNYISLEDVYNNYFSSTEFSPYNYIKVNEFIERISPYWVNIIEQFIPATTLWMGGNLIENGVLNRSKFRYLKPCLPFEVIQNLYPDFEAIKEDLETILGGGSMGGINEDKFREILLLNGVIYNLYININGNIFKKQTPTLLTEIFSGYTPTINETSLVASDAIPLICEYKDWFNLNLPTIKIIWKETLLDLIDDINGFYSKEVLEIEFFIDSDGVERVRFIFDNPDCTNGTNLNFHFEPSYIVIENECDLRVIVTTPPEIYVGETDDCYVMSNVNFTIDYEEGYTAGIETGNENPFNFYAVSGTSCGPPIEGECQVCSFEEVTPGYVQYDSNTATFTIPDVYEYDIYEIIVSDAANCEQKIRINGLSPKVEIGVGLTGYSVNAIVEYLPSEDYGLKKGSVVYKANQQVPLLTKDDLIQAIENGDIEEVQVENVNINDILLTIIPKNPSQYSVFSFNDIISNGAQFAFDYGYVQVTNKQCLSSIKKDIINNEFEILPTSKVYVYSNINESLEIVPYRFTYKYPEDIFTKPEIKDEPCCDTPADYQLYGDYLVGHLGNLIEVTGLTLNYCDGGIYYRFDVDGVNVEEDTILLNGPYNPFTNQTKIVVSHKRETFNCLGFNIQQYYLGGYCMLIPTIEELKRTPCEYGINCNNIPTTTTSTTTTTTLPPTTTTTLPPTTTTTTTISPSTTTTLPPTTTTTLPATSTTSTTTLPPGCIEFEGIKATNLELISTGTTKSPATYIRENTEITEPSIKLSFGDSFLDGYLRFFISSFEGNNMWSTTETYMVFFIINEEKIGPYPYKWNDDITGTIDIPSGKFNTNVNFVGQFGFGNGTYIIQISNIDDNGIDHTSLIESMTIGDGIFIDNCPVIETTTTTTLPATTTTTTTPPTTTTTTTPPTTTTTTTGTTTTTTGTTTTTTTTTGTTTTTTENPINECLVLMLSESGDLFNYNPGTKILTYNSTDASAINIASTSDKLWIFRSSYNIFEYNISLTTPLMITYSRTISINDLVTGVVAVASRMVVGGVGNKIYRYDLSGHSAIRTTVFTLPAGRVVSGDVVYNSKYDRYIVVNSNNINVKFISEFAYNALLGWYIVTEYSTLLDIKGFYQYDEYHYVAGNIVYTMGQGGLVQYDELEYAFFDKLADVPIKATSQVHTCISDDFIVPTTTTTTIPPTTTTTIPPSSTTTTTTIPPTSTTTTTTIPPSSTTTTTTIPPTSTTTTTTIPPSTTTTTTIPPPTICFKPILANSNSVSFYDFSTNDLTSISGITTTNILDVANTDTMLYLSVPGNILKFNIDSNLQIVGSPSIVTIPQGYGTPLGLVATTSPNILVGTYNLDNSSFIVLTYNVSGSIAIATSIFNKTGVNRQVTGDIIYNGTNYILLTTFNNNYYLAEYTPTGTLVSEIKINSVISIQGLIQYDNKILLGSKTSSGPMAFYQINSSGNLTQYTSYINFINLVGASQPPSCINQSIPPTTTTTTSTTTTTTSGPIYIPDAGYTFMSNVVSNGEYFLMSGSFLVNNVSYAFAKSKPNFTPNYIYLHQKGDSITHPDIVSISYSYSYDGATWYEDYLTTEKWSFYGVNLFGNYTPFPSQGFTAVNYCRDLAWNGNCWVGVGWAGSTRYSIAKSTNGVTWYGVDNQVKNLNTVAWNGSKWCAAGDSSGSFTNIIYSDNIDATWWYTTINNVYHPKPFEYRCWWLTTNGSIWVMHGHNESSGVLDWGVKTSTQMNVWIDQPELHSIASTIIKPDGFARFVGVNTGYSDPDETTIDMPLFYSNQSAQSWTDMGSYVTWNIRDVGVDFTISNNNYLAIIKRVIRWEPWVETRYMVFKRISDDNWIIVHTFESDVSGLFWANKMLASRYTPYSIPPILP